MSSSVPSWPIHPVCFPSHLSCHITLIVLLTARHIDVVHNFRSTGEEYTDPTVMKWAAEKLSELYYCLQRLCCGDNVSSRKVRALTNATGRLLSGEKRVIALFSTNRAQEHLCLDRLRLTHLVHRQCLQSLEVVPGGPGAVTPDSSEPWYSTRVASTLTLWAISQACIQMFYMLNTNILWGKVLYLKFHL